MCGGGRLSGSSPPCSNHSELAVNLTPVRVQLFLLTSKQTSLKKIINYYNLMGPGVILQMLADLGKGSSVGEKVVPYSNVVVWIPGQGTYKKQTMNA